MFRSRSWFGGGLWKPKNPHSLEHLKYLYNVLAKNGTVNDNNRSLLVETLRAIAEILIWGDQNDSTVFDFFLEKNMLSFFLKIMRQKCGSYVCVQLLQTLNILFENIRNETSLYYLLSNNHVNSIIVHKFDFSDEEVMAYYISFLKTLSLKLNSHTIHFFYNEHTHDFPLYTEAIKFFNNSESMVRIAVRTLTLNVYRVDDKSMLKFIRDKTAAPYFSNLVWFIGNHVFELDTCIRENSTSEVIPRLSDLVAEHLDHLHYLNDILCLEISDLNQVLTEHLLHRLFIPLYVSSLDKNSNTKLNAGTSPRISGILAVFLLSQVFLIITHSPLVKMLANIVINGNEAIFEFKPDVVGEGPAIPISSLEIVSNERRDSSDPSPSASPNHNSAQVQFVRANNRPRSPSPEKMEEVDPVPGLETFIQSNTPMSDLSVRPFLNLIIESLDCGENDYAALFALCLLTALHDNAGVNPELLSKFFSGKDSDEPCDNCKPSYNENLVEYLISIISQTVKYESKVRVVALQLVISLLLKMVMKESESCLSDAHLATLEGAREENILLLQSYYKTDELFLEVFEDEYLDMSAAKAISIEHLMMDSNLLLPPAGSPLTGISFDKRLPCGEVERSRRAMRVYFLLRNLSLTLRKETEKYLPLTNTQTCVHIDDNLDLTNSDMLACTLLTKDSAKTRRFLVIDVFQLILVEPSLKRVGWGIVKFVGFLQDLEVLGDKEDSRCLNITVKTSPTSQRGSQSKKPLLAAKFLFDDHIRCMAAKQRLVKGKQRARQRKLHMIARLLDLTGSSPSPPANLRGPARRPLTRSDNPHHHRPLYTPISRTLPGLAIPVVQSRDTSSTEGGTRRKSKEGSPIPSSSSSGVRQDEEIPLGNIKNMRGSKHKHQNLQRAEGTTETETNDSLKMLTPSSRLTLDLIPGLGGGNKPGTIQEIGSPLENNLPTPQTETSFMTMPPTSSTGFNHSNHVDSNLSKAVESKPVRKKKGAIHTV